MCRAFRPKATFCHDKSGSSTAATSVAERRLVIRLKKSSIHGSRHQGSQRMEIKISSSSWTKRPKIFDEDVDLRCDSDMLFGNAVVWRREISFFRVFRMYRQTGFCRFSGSFGLWKINNLLVFSAPWPFD